MKVLRMNARSGLVGVILVSTFAISPKLASSNSPAVQTEMEVQLAGGMPVLGQKAVARPGNTLNFSVFLGNNGNATGPKPRIEVDLGPFLIYTPDSSIIVVKEDDGKTRHYDMSDKLIKIEDAGRRVTWGISEMAPRPEKSVFVHFKAKLKDDNYFHMGSTTLSVQAVSSFTGAQGKSNPVFVNVIKDSAPVVTIESRTELSVLSVKPERWLDEKIGNAGPSDKVAYLFTVLNSGNTDAKDVRLQVLLPDELKVVGEVTLGFQNEGGHRKTSLDDKDSASLFGAGLVVPFIPAGTGGFRAVSFTLEPKKPFLAPTALTVTGRTIYNGVTAGKAGSICVFGGK